MSRAFQLARSGRPPATPVQDASHNHKFVGVGATAEAKVIAANRAFYCHIADRYDRYESCAFQPFWQQTLQKDIDTIQSSLTASAGRLHCLDFGGGTGNFALKMLARGWNVTVVDVSPEMLTVLSKKARGVAGSPKLVCSPIERFLERTPAVYDLVAFSSVLHHLHSYVSVVEQAAAAVRVGGIFYSNYDPAVPRKPHWTGFWNALDIAVAKARFDAADFLPGVSRRLRKGFARADPLFGRPLVSAGDLAEFHARTGLDDLELLELLRRKEFTIIAHMRYPAGRTRTVQSLNRMFRLLENFKIIARREA